ncbi:MAG TPA: adenylate/guanylate cyclase domain-containing protein [Azospira sp.]|nr:adenylate/guanylate cyclase domain-containing protein [Azospira sp.]
MFQNGFFASLREAGLSEDDTAEVRLNKSLLIFATGLISATAMLWLVIYWLLGTQVSSAFPLAFQLIIAGNLLLYLKTRDFSLFRSTQLTLFLLMPFAAQWSMGNYLSASGISLWGLLAPIGAILFFGVRESLAWFAAYLLLTLLTGMVDYQQAATFSPHPPSIALPTSIAFFALNFAAVSTIVYLLLRFSAVEKQKIQARMEEAHRLLKLEQERSERLLLDILPGPVAQRLKQNEQTIADGFADVTVMFADIVNFTQVAEGLSPQQVFSMLNKIFYSFDELAEQHGLEKIKTIGDAYMVAGGLLPGEEDYADAMADLALTMRDLLYRDFTVNRMRLEIRIGICSGPVVAGVVGKRKFTYDLWGDTVNIASRLTSEGMPGMIQVDATTYQHLRERYEFQPPQTLHFKGKGELQVYRLLGRRETPGQNPESLVLTAP